LVPFSLFGIRTGSLTSLALRTVAADARPMP
jgi:hypothetical protein